MSGWTQIWKTLEKKQYWIAIVSWVTCFNDDHKPAIVLQQALEERYGAGEVINIVDHLWRTELWGTFELTFTI